MKKSNSTTNTSTIKPSVQNEPSASNDFPKYLMVIDGKLHFVPFREAYVAYDNGFVPVEFGQYVLNHDFSVREMTEEDKSKISDAADEYSASK